MSLQVFAFSVSLSLRLSPVAHSSAHMYLLTACFHICVCTSACTASGSACMSISTGACHCRCPSTRTCWFLFLHLSLSPCISPWLCMFLGVSVFRDRVVPGPTHTGERVRLNRRCHPREPVYVYAVVCLPVLRDATKPGKQG